MDVLRSAGDHVRGVLDSEGSSALLLKCAAAAACVAGGALALDAALGTRAISRTSHLMGTFFAQVGRCHWRTIA